MSKLINKKGQKEKGVKQNSRLRDKKIHFIIPIPITFLAISLVGILIGGVVGLTVTQLTDIRISIFSQGVTSSDFSATTKSTVPKKSEVEITITVTNGDSVNPHSAEVTVTCYDASDNVLASITNIVTDLAASSSIDEAFTFTQGTHGVDQDTYATHDIVILQTA